MKRSIFRIALLCVVLAPIQAAQAQQDRAQYTQHVAERLSELEQNIAQALQNEENAERIFDEYISIMREIMYIISPEGNFGVHMRAMYDEAESNFIQTHRRANPDLNALAERFQAQAIEIVQIRQDARRIRSQGMRAIRSLEDEREVVVMLVRAYALDMALDSAREHLAVTRVFVDEISNLTERMETEPPRVAD